MRARGAGARALLAAAHRAAGGSSASTGATRCSGARAFIRHYAWTFPNLRDAEGTVGNAYRLTVLPTTFVLDAHGRIRATLRGPQSEHSLQARCASVERS